MPVRRVLNLAVLIAVFIILCLDVASAEDNPLALRDVARMKRERMPLEKIVDKAAEQGISFEVTPGMAKQLGRMGFSDDQIDVLRQSYGTKKDSDKAASVGARSETGPNGGDKAAAGALGHGLRPAPVAAEPLVPGEGLPTSEAARDRIQEQVERITRVSGANVLPVATAHVTLWADKKDQAAYLGDIKKLERFVETKCKEPLRSGLDKRAAHIVLLKTRYDYEKWVKAMFDDMPETFRTQDPDGGASVKAAILKWVGYYSHHFIVLCTENQDTEWMHRLAAAGVGYMNFVQQIGHRRQDPLATGFSNGMESVLMGSPAIMLFSAGYNEGNRDLGKDPREWLNLVKDRFRTKKTSGVRQLLSMSTSNMVLPHYAEAWTLTGLLMKQPDKYAALLRELRGEKDPLAAIEKVYGWDEKKLEEQWRKEVLSQR